MRGPPEIHAHGADELHVFPLARVWQRIAQAGIRLMPVDPTNRDTFAVEEESGLRVETEPAEAQGHLDGVDGAIALAEGAADGV